MAALVNLRVLTDRDACYKSYPGVLFTMCFLVPRPSSRPWDKWWWHEPPLGCCWCDGEAQNHPLQISRNFAAYITQDVSQNKSLRHCFEKKGCTMFTEAKCVSRRYVDFFSSSTKKMHTELGGKKTYSSQWQVQLWTERLFSWWCAKQFHRQKNFGSRKHLWKLSQ